MTIKLDILKLVSNYITEKHKNKTWTSGKDWVQYAGPYFDDNEILRAVSTLLDEWLVLGEDAIKFEKAFPPLLGKRHGVVVNSGSSANLLMMVAAKKIFNLEEKKCTHVIVPVAGFPTTVNPILQAGLTPVFVDIELDTLNLNLDQLEQAAKNGARVLTFAHVLGNPPNMDRVMEIVKEYDIILLEDCCDALGSTWKGTPVGKDGVMSTCSFYPAHHMTMGEGGFVACATEIQEKVVRSLREWGRGCFKKGTLINSYECSKPIETLKIGDSVVTHNGNNKKITKLFQKEYDGNYYTFKCKLKGKISSTDYHPHLILTPTLDEPQWIEAKDIKIGDYFMEKIPYENNSDEYFTWTYKTLYKQRHETIKADADLMRLIGYWLAEGCVNKGLKGKNCPWYAYTISFHFNSNESVYVEDVNRLMLKYFGVKGFPGRKKFIGNSTATCFKSRKAYEFFLQHFNKLSYKKSLPEKMVNWNSTLTNELVNGYWRGDGNYCNTNNSFRLDSVSFNLIEQMRRILLKHGIITSYFNIPKEKRQKNQILNGKIINAKHDIHTIVAYGKNAELFSTQITKTPIISKSDKFNAFIANGYVLYPVTDIAIIPIKETVYNLEVEDDHSFHAHGIATHNCYCVGRKANLSTKGNCGCRFNNWLPSLKDEIFDHKYVYDNIGYNLKPIEIQCSIGLAQLDKLPTIHARRKENHARLTEIFAPYEEFFHIHKATEHSDPSWFAFPITVKNKSPFKRSKFTQYMEDNKIQTRNYFGGNLLLQPAYKNIKSTSWLGGTIDDAKKLFPIATKVTTDTLFLGTSPVISSEQLDYVNEKVQTFFKKI